MLRFGGRADEAPLGDIGLSCRARRVLREAPAYGGRRASARPIPPWNNWKAASEGAEPQRGLQHGAGPRSRKRVSTQCLNRSFPFLIHWYNGRFVMRILGALLLCSALGQGA